MEFAGLGFPDFILLVIVFVLFFCYSDVKEAFFGGKIDSSLRNFDEDYQDLIKNGLLLIKDLPFYKALDEQGKRKLIKDAIAILQRREMVNEHNNPLDLERSFKMALVLAVVVFGLNEGTHFDGLKKVKVFDHPFYSSRVQSKVRGLSYSNGDLAISWDDFMYGFTTNEDRYNVGFHEAAHMLHICGYVNINKGKWNRLANNFIYSAKHNGDLGLFRPYAITNIHEFWACCVEQFLEMPEEFKNRHLEIYRATKVMMGY